MCVCHRPELNGVPYVPILKTDFYAGIETSGYRSGYQLVTAEFGSLNLLLSGVMARKISHAHALLLHTEATIL